MNKPKDNTFYLVFILSVIFALWVYFVPYDLVERYQAKTIKKVSNTYNEPIFLIFNWETEDEIQVGKKIS